ncbi:YifB family Mg chelatase-like AAA ATPase [Leptospira inadai]|nr:YifB family Mg chelatase-like AAA ATPase [Leptospira inadai]PNV76375.1 ATP-binding protein [Leptospira inadai serovar Lyme]
MEDIRLIRLKGASLEGLQAFPVQVEVNLKRGIPRFTITGLAATAIKESADRIRIAIENSGFDYPLLNVLVHLGPAGKKKEGTYLDLPIAAGLLTLTGQCNQTDLLKDLLLLGELGLDGSLRPVKGILPILQQTAKDSCQGAVVPFENRQEAALQSKFPIYSIRHLRDLEALLSGKLRPEKKESLKIKEESFRERIEVYQDQLPGLRAIQIAVAGWHHCLLSGPPGAGKSLLARLAFTLLPPIRESEALDLLSLRSLRELVFDLEVARPFRSPHHTTSDIALVGGSRTLNMGEVTLASHGILFLDELAEFRSGTLQALREPMEEGLITVSRISGSITYPCPFLLIGAMNPCPCGYFQAFDRPCFCRSQKVQAYQSSVTGPFLDRIEIFLHLKTGSKPNRERVTIDLELLRASVARAARMQEVRLFQKTGKLYNGALRGEEILETIHLSTKCKELVSRAVQKRGLSIRKALQLRKLGRTIADLEESGEVEERHLEEALVFLNSGWFPENRAAA